MNFNTKYSIFHNIPFECNLKKYFRINNIYVGSGGSHNLILDISDKNKHYAVIKIIPKMVRFNVKKKPNRDQLEIKFYQFLTKKYLRTDRTPHIVGIYNHKKCSPYDKLLLHLNPDMKHCPTKQDYLTKKINISHVQTVLCEQYEKYNHELIDKDYDMLLLEYCNLDLSYFLEWNMNRIKSEQSKFNLAGFIYQLERLFFQIIFTLTIIKDDYPGFIHGDFFVRNILLLVETAYASNDYVAYHYEQRIFYLPANGIYVKINDFGYSVLVNELEPVEYKYKKKYHKYNNVNPFNPKNDLFDFFYDIYDGQNMGTTSLMKLAKAKALPSKTIKVLRSFLSKFFDIKTIDRVNIINRELLQKTWYIDKIPVLENSLMTPREYLVGHYFKPFQDLPPNARIVKHFNDNY